MGSYTIPKIDVQHLYNVLNPSAVLIESTAYRTFRAPQFVMTPRFVKISAQLDF